MSRDFFVFCYDIMKVQGEKMELEIIGKFIKEQRKLKGITQFELSEKLGISEKTVSKWECGYGFPDASLMLPLCKELDINANELLSGKKLLEKEYKESAENNLVALKAQQEHNFKLLLNLEYVLGYFSTISFMILIFIASFCPILTVYRILIVAFAFLQFVIGVYFCLLIEKDAGFYECPNCHNKYVPTFKQICFSMHYGRTRHMKCPKCGKKSWQKKTIIK